MHWLQKSHQQKCAWDGRNESLKLSHTGFWYCIQIPNQSDFVGCGGKQIGCLKGSNTWCFISGTVCLTRCALTAAKNQALLKYFGHLKCNPEPGCSPHILYIHWPSEGVGDRQAMKAKTLSRITHTVTEGMCSRECQQITAVISRVKKQEFSYREWHVVQMRWGGLRIVPSQNLPLSFVLLFLLSLFLLHTPLFASFPLLSIPTHSLSSLTYSFFSSSYS